MAMPYGAPMPGEAEGAPDGAVSHGQETAPQFVTNLGQLLRGRFEEVKRDRYLAEEGWLRDLRQYLGIEGYDGNGLTEPERPETDRSRAFGRLTRTKVKSVDARMMDMLFPGGSDKNWAIEPSPDPSLPEEVLRTVMIGLAMAKLEQITAELAQMAPEQAAALAESGEMPNVEGALAELQAGGVPAWLAPTREELDQAIQQEAKTRAKAMERQIDDQLLEGRYVDHIRNVLHSGHLYGTGWFKGPLVERRRMTFWAQDPDSGQWALASREVDRPFFEYVPIWDVYPDAMDACSVDQLDGVFQRYVMTKAQVRALTKREDFDAVAIARYLAQRPEGDAPQYLTWEQDLRLIRPEDQGTIQGGRGRRYEVLEYTGYVDGHMLAQCGCQGISEEAQALEFRANVWLLGSQVIKATLTPYDDDSIDLYHIYRFERADTSIYGISIPSVMRDPQGVYNAALRAMLDNAGMSAGPVFEVNVDLLDPAEITQVKDMHPYKVVMRHGSGMDAQHPAVRAIKIDSHTSEFMKLCEFARAMADESTALPSYTYGDQGGTKAAKTVGGLSMLMGQANIVLKDAVRNYDDGITKPFLRALHHWNMQFNEREDIKGDYAIEATGASSLVAKEVRAGSLEGLAQGTLNPADEPYIKRGELNRERARALDLDPERFVRSEEEVEARRMAEAKAMAEAQAQQQAAAAAQPQGMPA